MGSVKLFFELAPLATFSARIDFRLKPARAAHCTVIAGLAARLHRTLLFVLEELHQLSDRRLLNAEPLLAGMIDRVRILVSEHGRQSAEPGRLRSGNELEKL